MERVSGTAFSDVVFRRRGVPKQNIFFAKIVAKDNDSHI